jgi:hypothetical protein
MRRHVRPGAKRRLSVALYPLPLVRVRAVKDYSRRMAAATHSMGVPGALSP